MVSASLPVRLHADDAVVVTVREQHTRPLHTVLYVIIYKS